MALPLVEEEKPWSNPDELICQKPRNYLEILSHTSLKARVVLRTLTNATRIGLTGIQPVADPGTSKSKQSVTSLLLIRCLLSLVERSSVSASADFCILDLLGSNFSSPDLDNCRQPCQQVSTVVTGTSTNTG